MDLVPSLVPVALSRHSDLICKKMLNSDTTVASEK